MKVLNQRPSIKGEFPKRIRCEKCNAELEYDKSDMFIGEYGLGYITCPCCNETIPVTQERIKPIIFPDTFAHTDKSNAKDIDNKTIADYVEEIRQELSGSAPGEWAMRGTGNCLVFGYKMEDDLNIIVTKDYYSDFIDLNVD